MDKAELIRHEIEKRRDHNLAIGNPLFAAMAEEDTELLSFIDSLQEKHVSVWHDVSEEPKPNMELICVGQYGNPLVLSSNSNSFKERYISKWAYFNDLLNINL